MIPVGFGKTREREDWHGLLDEWNRRLDAWQAKLAFAKEHEDYSFGEQLNAEWAELEELYDRAMYLNKLDRVAITARMKELSEQLDALQ